MQGRPRRWPRWLAITLVAVAILTLGWTWWSRDNPRADRQLRSLVSQQLHAWFPTAMAPDDGWHGLYRRDPQAPPQAPPVLLIHGLDEPGGHLVGVVGLDHGGQGSQGSEGVRGGSGGDHALGGVAEATSIEYVFWLCSFLPFAGLLTVFLPNMEKGRAR